MPEVTFPSISKVQLLTNTAREALATTTLAPERIKKHIQQAASTGSFQTFIYQDHRLDLSTTMFAQQRCQELVEADYVVLWDICRQEWNDEGQLQRSVEPYLALKICWGINASDAQ